MLTKRQELDRHLRRYFPELVEKLKEEGKYEEHLQSGVERWREVYHSAIERGLNHSQAIELARDAVFPTPEPFQEPSQE
jgi:hypothetical protein